MDDRTVNFMPERTPTAEGLPDACYAYHESDDKIVVLMRGERGYFLPGIPFIGTPSHSMAAVLNDGIGVTIAQSEAMFAGSMFGWGCPAANPANYDEAGKPLRK